MSEQLYLRHQMLTDEGHPSWKEVLELGWVGELLKGWCGLES